MRGTINLCLFSCCTEKQSIQHDARDTDVAVGGVCVHVRSRTHAQEQLSHCIGSDGNSDDIFVSVYV